MRSVAVLIAAASSAFAAAPTYNKDIAPILYQNCAGCHRPGEVAPFSLLTYQDTAKRAALIATITKARVMPPWKAEPGYGDFRDVRRLSDEQRELGNRRTGARGDQSEGHAYGGDRSSVRPQRVHRARWPHDHRDGR